MRSLNRIKRDLLILRRAILPHREAVSSLIRTDSNFVTDHAKLYLRDTYDHCVQTADVTETYRELVGGLINLYLTSLANRTNDIMKILTIMASLLIPLTFMAGIYGMNFENMPELHYRWGYPILLATMLATALVMVVYFRRKGWIGSPPGPAEHDRP